ncbi:PTS glucose transporter subunit IIA, partial [Cutibacterium acnes]
MTPISSPMAGDVHPLADVPDPVFAQGLVGPGVAIVPIGEAEVTVVAPIAGRIVKLHPHAFVIQAEGFGVLVHLGIDTVQLDGRG